MKVQLVSYFCSKMHLCNAIYLIFISHHEVHELSEVSKSDEPKQVFSILCMSMLQ